MTELDRAIEDLRKTYEKAQQDSTINNPLAYALYHTWVEVDRKKIKQRPNMNKFIFGDIKNGRAGSKRKRKVRVR